MRDPCAIPPSLCVLSAIFSTSRDSSRDYDFLSSLELIIIDQADVYHMQNWDHLLHLLNHTHLQPKESHGVDFSRVRSWCLNGWGKFYKQLLVFSSFVTPEVNSLKERGEVEGERGRDGEGEGEDGGREGDGEEGEERRKRGRGEGVEDVWKAEEQGLLCGE